MVAAPGRLARLERGAASDRDEDVLESCPAWVVGVRIARDDGLDAERLGEVAERSAPPNISPLVRACLLYTSDAADE